MGLFSKKHYDMAIFAEEGIDDDKFVVVQQIMALRNNPIDYLVNVQRRDEQSGKMKNYKGIVLIGVTDYEYKTFDDILHKAGIDLVDMTNYNSRMYGLVESNVTQESEA